PRLARRLRDDTRHHFGHVDFAEPLVEHHERLGPRRLRLVVEERLRIDALVPRIGEPLIALGNGVVCVGLCGVAALNRLSRIGGSEKRGAVYSSSLLRQLPCDTATFTQSVRHLTLFALRPNRGKAILCPATHVTQFDKSEPK